MELELKYSMVMVSNEAYQGYRAPVRAGMEAGEG